MNPTNFIYSKGIRYLLLLIYLITFSHVDSLAQSPLDGKYKQTYENGKIKVVGHYVSGEKHKLWMYYDETGRLTLKEKWNHGQLMWKAIYEKGKVVRTIDKNGKVTEKSTCGC